MMDEAFFTKVDAMTYFLDKSTAMLTQQVHEVSGHEGCTGMLSMGSKTQGMSSPG